MSVFVDTSAWFAVASTTDNAHADARSIYTALLEADESMVTNSYVVAETLGLMQRRLGWKPTEVFAATVRTVDVVWVDNAIHSEAEAILFGRRRRGLSIVDAAGIVVMHALGIQTAFAFDEDFEREGFAVLRPPD